MAKILVADDNSNIQKMVSLALQDQGIEVVAVGNGEAAVRKLPDIHPDLVLADVFMPVRNGYEVCEFVKSDPRFAHTPVILLVGAFDPLDEQEAQRVGADGVLKKPFVPPDPLVSMVKTALAKADHQRTASAQAAVEKPAPATAPPPVPPPEFQPTPMPEPELDTPVNEFGRAPERFSFSENEKPVAFGELLETPPAETSSEPSATGPIESSLDEHPFGKFPTSEEAVEDEIESPQESSWPGSKETLPRRGDAALLREAEPPVEEAAPTISEKTPEQPAAEGKLPELIQSADEWLADAAAHPPEPLPTSEEDSWIAAPTVESAPPPAEPPASEAAPPEPEPGSAGREHEPAREASEHLRDSWPPVPPPPPWEPPHAAPQPRSITPSPEDIASAVNSFELPKQPDPALIDAVVARVLERMQPQIMDVVTKEILRPVVEALVRRELEKH